MSPDSFESLQPALSDGVISYIKQQQFERMTPVQAATIPLFMASKDVAVQAVTGSGKTLAFLIPLVETVLKRKRKSAEIGAVVLSPTRELATQTHSVAKALCTACKLREPLLLVGGSSSASSGSTSRPVTGDLKAFQELGSDIIIGTPGRVEDILTRYAVMDTSELDYLILDEADVLLNMGFATTLQSILSRLPKMRRTGLFSATTSTTVNSSLKDWMVKAGLRNPVWIDVAVTTTTQPSESNRGSSEQQVATPSSLTNYYMITPMEEKFSRLTSFLEQHRDETVIVFFLTCACVEFYSVVAQRLLKNVYVESLHGKMVQKRREKAMERFRECASERSSEGKKGGALFCTDVAARGLDIPNLHWVVQFDAPQDPAFYVHRVGRSGRAGRPGRSLLFLTRKEEPYIDLLERRKVPLIPLPSTERCCPPLEEEQPIVEETKGPEKIVNINGDTLEDMMPRIYDLVLQDRDVLEKGTKAFTSYIRAYKEHHCSFIFRFASLDLGTLATAFCLLRLPKMPELRDVLRKHGGRLPRFNPAGAEVNIFAIPFLDRTREAARQKRLKQDLEAGGKSAKLIKAEQRKADKERRLKDRRQAAIDKGRNPDKKRGRQAQIMDEWDDLAKEERLYKKYRKGKLTKEEYDEAILGV